MAIKPVVNAIRVLERLVPSGSLLFDHGVHGQRAVAGAGSLNTETINTRIEDFITWAKARPSAWTCPSTPSHRTRTEPSAPAAFAEHWPGTSPDAPADSSRTARDVLQNPNLAVYDNPHAMLMCVYKPDKALCRRDTTTNTPTLDGCLSTCANIARIDHQAEQRRRRADELDTKAVHVPDPLAERLQRSATALRRAADRHDVTRITNESS
ncbi:hypothetical protein [Streptomyces sp. NPDC023838]|uniref:hypothetical protein n=1 Tax=Streptomyces sp. NPDC023838 TaxID=3154325 RepID=UPI0033DD4804